MKHFCAPSRLAAKLAAGLLALLFLLSLTSGVLAEPEAVLLPTPTSSNALIYNLQYEKVLFEKNANDLILPASFSKIMTAVLCYEHLSSLGTDITVTITEEDPQSRTGLALQTGETLSFKDLLGALVVGSSNDAATVLARVVGGTVEDFVTKMNERARELGTEQTLFANPTGLHDATAQTTLSDMAKICARAYEINDYMQTSSLLRYEIEPTNLREKKRVITNANFLLNPSEMLGYYVKGAMGINCGYTPQSGYCVSSVRETGGAINLVLVAGGIKNEANQNTALLDAMSLFSYAKDAFEITTVLKKESVVREIPVKLSDSQDHVMLITGSEITALLPKGIDPQTDLETRIFLSEETLTAPINEGTAYGSLEIYYEETLLGSTELVAQHSLARSTSLYLVNAAEQFLQLAPVRLILIIAAGAILLFLVFCLVLLLVQQSRKSGRSRKERKRQKELKKALLREETARQKAYFRKKRAENIQKIQEFNADMKEAKQARDRRLEVQRRREAAAARAAAQRPARPNAQGQMPRPAEGSERRIPRPAEGSERISPVRKASDGRGSAPHPNGTRPQNPQKRKQ